MSTLFCLTTAKRDSHTLTCYITHTPNQPNIAMVLLLSVVAGLIDVGMWGNEVLDNWGVTTMSRGLVGFGSGLMVSGSRLRWKCHLEMVARVDGSFS